MRFDSDERMPGMMFRSFLVVLTLVATLSGVPARAVNPDLKTSQYAHISWRPQDGFFSERPSSMAQTKDGYLWMGTRSGMLGFDGVRSVPFTTLGGQLLPSGQINALLGGNDGNLWIGSASALAQWKDGKLTPYPAIPGDIVQILEDAQGAIWVARDGGHDNIGPVCRILDGSTKCFGTAEGISTNDCCAKSLALDGATLLFMIPPAFYQTWWFRLLCGLAALGALWLFYLYQLKQATAKIQERLDGRMEERERIARELHDTLLQGFQGLMLRFQAVMKVLPENAPAQQMMEEVLDRADEVLLEGRQRVRELRAEGVGGYGLPTILTNCGEELSQDSETRFILTVVGAPRVLDQAICNDAYRIGRESLINAFQHATAAKVEVEITYEDQDVRLTVRDDGRGMDQAILDQGRDGHWGLAGMRERARKIGAKLSIWSHPGAGTEIELRIPAKIAYARASTGSRWFRRKSSKEEEE